MNPLLILYRISGWSVTLVNIFLALFALKTKRMWQGKYVYMSLYLICIAVGNIIASVTSILSVNNLFLDYLYIPIIFMLQALFLREQHQNQFQRMFVIIIILVFILINIFTAFYKEGYKEINTLGTFINTTFMLVFTIWNLTKLFKTQLNYRRLRQNPDFWFIATMFCFAFLGMLTSVITDTSYAAKSNVVLYIIYISQNFIDIGIYFGYYKAIKLMR
jgi:hypothetical protein